MQTLLPPVPPAATSGGGGGGGESNQQRENRNHYRCKKISKCKRESNKIKLRCPRGKPGRFKNTNSHCHGGSMTEDNKISKRVHRTNVVEETSSVSEARQLADPFTGRKMPVLRSRTRSGNPFGWRRKQNKWNCIVQPPTSLGKRQRKIFATVHSLASDIVEGPTYSIRDGSITLLAMVNTSSAFMVLVRISHFADGQINVLGYQSHQQQRCSRA